MSKLKFDKSLLKGYIDQHALVTDEVFNLYFDHFNDQSFVINKETSRFTDQKVTIDVVKVLAETLINISANRLSFLRKDIEQSKTFESKVTKFFKKPNPRTNSPKEYDKFISQPLCFLFFSKVLERKKDGKGHQYIFPDKESRAKEIMLSLNSEENILVFLFLFYIKTFQDSDCLSYFNRYYDGLIKTDKEFSELKTSYVDFIKENTAIVGDFEIPRIFNKIFNVLSYVLSENATEGGRLTKAPFSFADLRYNRVNFRDVGKKDKSQSREKIIYSSSKSADSSKFKNIVKKMHYPNSEILDESANEYATQAHHIFPEHAYPELACYLENIILLTPNQHNLKAHPNNKTAEINFEYQEKCLLFKLKSVLNYKDSYLLDKFCFILNIGFNVTYFSSNLSESDIIEKIREAYRKKLPQLEFENRTKKI